METIAPHLVPFMLVLSRLAGLFLFAPMLSSPMFPVRARVFLLFVMTLVIYPGIPASQQGVAVFDLASLAPMVVMETLIGLSVGAMAAIPIIAMQLAGQIVGQQLGLGLAAVYNPATDTEGDVMGELLLYMALAIFVSLGGLDLLFLCVASTFATVPLGGFPTEAVPLDMLLSLISAGFELALRVAAPVLCILFIETIAAGLLMKTLPQLNIMSVGFAIKIVVGLIALITAIAAIRSTLDVYIENILGGILRWCGSLSIRPFLLSPNPLF